LFGVGLLDVGGGEGAGIEGDVGEFLVGEEELCFGGWRETFIEALVKRVNEGFEVERGGGDAQFGGLARDGSDAVIGGEGDEDVGETDLFVEIGEEGVDVTVEG
jgi:hypothetical protein